MKAKIRVPNKKLIMSKIISQRSGVFNLKARKEVKSVTLKSIDWNLSNSTNNLPIREEPQDCNIYMVVVKENWGDPSTISCSYMNFLSKERSPLQPLKILTNPPLKDTSASLLLGDLVKDENKIFKTKWPLEDDSILSIIYFYPPTAKPYFLRLFNPKTNQETSIKYIEVYQGAKDIYHGEIEKSYWRDIALNVLPTKAITPSFSTNGITSLLPLLANKPAPKDKFGILPIPLVTKITIEILSNYGNESQLGLNYVSFFSDIDVPVPASDIENIEIDNVKSFRNLDYLIKMKNRSYDDEVMFMCFVDWNIIKKEKDIGGQPHYPKITFTFKRRLRITSVDIINFTGVLKGLDCGAKNIKITAKKIPLWVGMIPKGNLPQSDYNTIPKAKVISLIDKCSV